MADILCFPQQRNVGKARHVAELYLNRRTTKDRDVYWRTTKNRLAGVLERCGFPEAEIDKQIVAFTGAVQREIDIIHNFRATGRGSDNGPGAA